MKKQGPLVEARSRVGKLVKSAALLVLALLMAVSSSVSVHAAIKPPREPRPTVSKINDFYSAPPGYQNYNCYAYAIGKKTSLYPGQLSGYPDPFNSTKIRSEKDELYILRYVMQDLSVCGYTNIRKVSGSYVLRPGETMIAFAYGDMAPVGGAETPMESGFHAWVKRSKDDYWYHKMGKSSAIMRMKDGKAPSSDGAKNDEYYDGNQRFWPATSTIDSDSVYYFAFTTKLSVNAEPGQEQAG